MQAALHNTVPKHRLTDQQLGDQRAAVARNAPNAAVILDARDLHCHRSQRTADSWHNGMHPLIMESFADLPAAARWLAAAVLQVHAWGRFRYHSQGATSTFEVVVYCKSGKHRSVFAGYVMIWALPKLGWMVDLNVQDHDWRAECGCSGCNPETQQAIQRRR